MDFLKKKDSELEFKRATPRAPLSKPPSDQTPPESHEEFMPPPKPAEDTSARDPFFDPGPGPATTLQPSDPYVDSMMGGTSKEQLTKPPAATTEDEVMAPPPTAETAGSLKLPDLPVMPKLEPTVFEQDPVEETPFDPDIVAGADMPDTVHFEGEEPVEPTDNLDMPGMQNERQEPPEETFDAETAQAEESFAQEYVPENIPEKPAPTGKSYVDPLPELPDAPDEFADEPAGYLAEEEDDAPQEFYVEAESFYESLQDVKEAKKCLRDQDADMRAWEETDDALEKKSKEVLANVDHLQEELIKIDTVLFGG